MGTWGSLKEKLSKDDQGNAVANVELHAVDASQNLVVGSGSETGQKFVALKGLHNHIVVDTPHALLVCPASEEQWVKTLVGELKREKGEPLV